MTDQPETPKILDQISKSTNASATRNKQQTRLRFFIFLLAPLFVAIGLLGFKQFEMQAVLMQLRSAEDRAYNWSLLLQQQQEEMQRLRDQIAILSTMEDRNETASLTLQARVDADLAELNGRVAELVEAGNEDIVPQDSRWKILEANYIARLAAQKIEFERDILSAVTLLQRSDRALFESGSTEVLSVRQQLAKEIEVLRSISGFDQEEAIFRLHALIEQVEGVRLLGSKSEKLLSNQTAVSAKPDYTVDDTRGMLDTTLEFLGTVFVWRTWEDSYETILAPGQDELIRQSFRLMLEQGKVAVTNRSNQLYQHHLQNALDWLQTYVATDAGPGEAAYLELEELAALDVNPELPSFSGLLRDLEQLSVLVR